MAGKIVALDHVPKRATQHAVYLASDEAPLPSLKPGQVGPERQDFYTTAAEARPLRETYLTANQTAKSIYKEFTSENGIPEDYLDKVAAKAPATQTNDPGPDPTRNVHRATDHWVSQYGDTFHDPGRTEYVRHRGPMFAPVNPPACISQPAGESMSQSDYGKYGRIPRDIFPASADKYPDKKTDLTSGTTIGTHHIPGYNGFLPTNTHNPRCAKIEQGAEPRVKPGMGANMSEIYHQNVPGYTGFLPTDARNDLGPRQITSRTTFGRAYTQAHWQGE
jgi:hypothetical protein